MLVSLHSFRQATSGQHIMHLNFILLVALVRRRDRADAVYAQFAGRVGGHNSSLPKVRIEHTPELGLMVLHPINKSALKGKIGRILLCGFDRVSLRG